MSVSDQFWDASFSDLKRGFAEEEDRFVCLLCGESIEKGIIYPEDGVLYEAVRYMQRHIEKAHHSVFDHLIQLDKKWSGLSDHQSNLLQRFYLGKSDQEIQKELGIGSTSTIRNHRFALKEKERQAKVLLVLMDLLRAPKEARVPDEKENTQAGVYMIKNTINQKMLIASTRNLKTINGKRFTLNHGTHLNKALQQDWNEYGEDAFVIEVLETVKHGGEDLAHLEEKWLDKLQPFGERGYHPHP